MPPKKQPSKLTSQASSLNPPATPRTYRQPLPVPPLPPSDTIPPLWTPNAVPTEAFPEWTDPATLPLEHWGTAEEPFEDSLPPTSLLLPREAVETKNTVTWKRPLQFLPAIVDTPMVPATPPVPTAPDPKAVSAKKAGAPAAAAKKGEPEPPKRPPPPKHAHIFISKADFALLEGKKAGSLTASVTAQPSAPGTAVDHHPDQEYYIPRDFQRRWSAEEVDALEAWSKEEERIKREQQHRERVYMAFEDAIAYIVNDRPRDLLAEVDFDAEDLVDDGEDEDEGLQSEMDSSNATSPWGVMPPPRIEIAPNAIYKPETPHGEIIHADMASYFRIVEQLHDSYYEKNDDGTAGPAPFLWQAIYPQDSTGYPIYNPGGKYSVKLFVLGRWRRIDVDDKLPLDSNDNVVYLASSLRGEIWPSLLVKALYKVMHWLHPHSMKTDETTMDLADIVCQSTVQIILALTSWKISRWEPRASQSFSENIFHQLLQYVPTGYQIEEATEVVETEAVADSTSELPLTSAEIELTTISTSSNNPRAIICCVGGDEPAQLTCGEVVLVTDVVGDTGNTTFKILRQTAPATISEEVAGMDQFVFLLVHPMMKYSDTFIRSWVPNPEPPLEGVVSSNGALVPFETPRVQFVVVLMEEKLEQPPGDSSGDISHDSQALVNLVTTLTPVQSQGIPSQQPDNLSKPSVFMATHLGVDSNGSVILIEEPEKNANGRSCLPSIVTLSSIFSGYIRVPPVDKGNIVYRVYPQKTLRYGYSLQVDSDHQVVFRDASTHWRSLSHLHVVESDGSYPVMLPGTWNILFKQSFELTPPMPEKEEDGEELVGPSSAELRVDLHLSEELLASSSHISIVNDLTNEVKKVGTLCSKITLSTPGKAVNSGEYAPAAFTMIVDCAPGNFHVREGTWKLTLASDWNFTKSTTHRMKMTRFEDTYVPNKPLLCFRDVIIAPKASIWASFELQLLRDGAVVNDLATKLEVFDSGADQHPKIGEASSNGEVRLLQLPTLPTAENGQPPVDDKRGYIIQGSIDKAVCNVPSELQSLRPFRTNSTATNALKDKPIPAGETLSGELSQQGEPAAFGTARSFRAPSSVKWRLNCWSSEEVKLQEDNTKELRYEAIRASWAENAIGRDTNGAVSRLLHLGKVDEAEAKMKQEGMTDEQMIKMRSRFEWIQSVKATVNSNSTGAEGAGGYLEEIASADENILSDDQQEENKRVLQERISVVEAEQEQRRVARAAAKEERASETKKIVRSVIERRAASNKQHQERRREFTALQTQSA